MVLSRALRPFVLIVRILLLAPLAVAAGCGQSLFDAHGGGRDGGGGGDDGGGGDGDVPDTCPSPCLADAGADYDGTAGGKGNHWRYVEDNRNRTWTPMVAAGTAQVGVDMRNSFKRCADDPSAAACKALPGALLVATGGRSSRAEPAIEFPVGGPGRVLRIALRAHAPAGAHTIRLYRNSREDVLFTMPAEAGVTVEHAVTVDAVPGDRFLVAISPDTDAGGAVALHVFVSDPGAAFPVTCQHAVPFTAPGVLANTVDDLCRTVLLSLNGTMPTAPSLLDGPYLAHGKAAYLENTYYQAPRAFSPVDAMTVQLWFRAEGTGAADGWMFSNVDVDKGLGLGLRLKVAGSSATLQASVVQSINPLTYASQGVPIATPFDWHFVRVVHARSTVSFCVDGAKVGGGALAGPSVSTQPMNIGRNAQDTSSYYVGDIDDVRVFLEALPCE